MNLRWFLYISCLVESCSIYAVKASCVVQDPLNILIDAHDNFGKTHFILGYTPEKVPKTKKELQTVTQTRHSYNFVNADGAVRHAFFMPDDHLQEKLIQLIRSEKKSIIVTAYAFSNGDIAQAFADAARRGVAIEMIIDPGILQDPYNKIDIVHEAHVPIYVYNPQYVCNNVSQKNKMSKKKRTGYAFNTLMHNKFLIFGNNVAGKALLWTGSCNLTNTALKPKTQADVQGIGNQENATLTDDMTLIKKYEKQVEKLKERSTKYDEIKSTAHLFIRRRN